VVTYSGRGFPPVGLLLFIIGRSPPFIDGGAPFTLVGGLASIFRISSGEGMPGVGVAPGLKGLRSSAGLGIPGVGVVPFGATAFALTPCTFAPICTGLAESPGGMFAGSISVVVGAALAFV